MHLLNKHITQNIVWRGFYFGTMLLLNIVLARSLAAETFGNVYYIINVLSFFVLLFGLNLNSGITYYNASNQIHQNKLAVLSVVASVLGAFLLVVLIPIYFQNCEFDLHIKYGNQIPWFCFFFCLGSLLINSFSALYYSNHTYSTPNIIIGCSNLLFIFFLISFAKQANNQQVSLYFALFLLQGFLVALFFFAKHKVFINAQIITPTELKQLLGYSLISLAGNVLFFLVYRMDYWFVKAWCANTNDLGNYIQASKLLQLLLLLPQMIATTIFPQTASNTNDKAIQQSIKSISLKMLLGFFAVFAILFLWGEEIFMWVFGNSFCSMNKVILIQLPGVFCIAFSTLLSAYFSGKKQNRFTLYAAIIALVIMLAASFSLKDNYSIYVAAAISSVAYCAEGLFCLYKFMATKTHH